MPRVVSRLNRQHFHTYSCIHTVLSQSADGQDDEMLFKIKGSHWYTNNAQLQAYLENEWLNCKPVSVSNLFKSSMSSNGIVIGYHSSGLTYFDNVSTTVLTPTILQNLSTMSSKTIIIPFIMTSQSFLLPRFSSSVSCQTKKENIQL